MLSARSIGRHSQAQGLHASARSCGLGRMTRLFNGLLNCRCQRFEYSKFQRP